MVIKYPIFGIAAILIEYREIGWHVKRRVDHPCGAVIVFTVYPFGVGNRGTGTYHQFAVDRLINIEPSGIPLDRRRYEDAFFVKVSSANKIFAFFGATRKAQVRALGQACLNNIRNSGIGSLLV